MTPEEYLDKIAKDNAPIGRFATPEELANFLSSQLLIVPVTVQVLPTMQMEDGLKQ